MAEPNRITVFEHETLHEHKGEQKLSPEQLLKLQEFHGEKGIPYFSLVHRGIRFCEWVGVLQVGNIIIEVLPKADRNRDKDSWREVLIGMLKAAGLFDIHAPSSSDLKLKTNSILDLYFELFLTEAEELLHKGLVKRYRKTEGNLFALKGSIQFDKHIRENIVHQERFYVRYTTYDREHPLNRILYKTLHLLDKINTNPLLGSRIGNLLLNFPELPDISADERFFERIIYNRKTQGYKKAIDIARLLLLNYHPDLTQSKNDVLALMFDMNLLWEQFIYMSLRKYKKPGVSINYQSRKDFWKPDIGRRQRMIPDIVINKGKVGQCIVLDTKWKNLNGAQPSPDDLRQLYIYSKFHNEAQSALIYPGETDYSKGRFYDEEKNTITDRECGIHTISVEKNIKKWQALIAETVFNTNRTK